MYASRAFPNPRLLQLIMLSKVAFGQNLTMPTGMNLTLLSASEQVPWEIGMNPGYGYNTYTEEICVEDAAIVTTQSSKRAARVPTQSYFYSELISDYTQLTEMLDISAAASIKAPQGSGSIEAKFLDKSSLDTSTVTYVVRADVQFQRDVDHFSFNWHNYTNPQERFGDRFIAGFVEGAALYARISITTKDESHSRDVEAAASVAVTLFGGGGTLDTKVKDSISTLNKYSQTTITMYTIGAPPSYGKGSNSIEALNDVVNQFFVDVNDPKNIPWKRFAILQKYDTLHNFYDEFTPLDYTSASRLTWPVAWDYANYTAIHQLIQDTNFNHFQGGHQQQTLLKNAAANAMNETENWVDKVSLNPTAVNTPPNVTSIDDFTAQVMAALSKEYIAQTSSKNGCFLDTEKHSDSTELFRVRGFDFDGIPGTVQVTFGRKTDYVKTFAVGGPLPDGFQTISTLWLSTDATDGGLDQPVSFFNWTRGLYESEVLQFNNKTAPDAYSTFWGNLYGVAGTTTA